MPCRHPAARIHVIVKAPKALVAGQSVSPQKCGSHGLGFEAFVGRLGGLFSGIRYHGVTGVNLEPGLGIDNRPGTRFAMSTFAAPLASVTGPGANP